MRSRLALSLLALAPLVVPAQQVPPQTALPTPGVGLTPAGSRFGESGGVGLTPAGSRFGVSGGVGLAPPEPVPPSGSGVAVAPPAGLLIAGTLVGSQPFVGAIATPMPAPPAVLAVPIAPVLLPAPLVVQVPSAPAPSQDANTPATPLETAPEPGALPAAEHGSSAMPGRDRRLENDHSREADGRVVHVGPETALETRGSGARNAPRAPHARESTSARGGGPSQERQRTPAAAACTVRICGGGDCRCLETP